MSSAKLFLEKIEDMIGVRNAFESEDIDRKEEAIEENTNDYEAHRQDHE